MAKVKIYHNPRCSKSRQALELLTAAGHEIEVVDYLKVGLEKSEVEVLYNLLGNEVDSLIRTKEAQFKDAPFDVTNKEAVITGLVAQPKLLERPILISGKKAIIGRPVEKIDGFL